MMKEIIIIYVHGISFDGSKILPDNIQTAREKINEKLKNFFETKQAQHQVILHLLFINSSSGNEFGNEDKGGIHITFIKGDQLSRTLFREQDVQEIFKDELKGWCHGRIMRFFINATYEVTSNIEVIDAAK